MLRRLYNGVSHRINILRQKTLQQKETFLFHKVDEPLTDFHKLSLPPKIFLEKIYSLIKNHKIVPLSRLNESSSNSISITFDDGFKDNYMIVLPILKKMNIPATFFITTGYIDTNRELWVCQLEELFSRLKGTLINYAEQGICLNEEFTFSTYTKLFKYLESRNIDEHYHFFEAMQEQHFEYKVSNRFEFQIMSSQEILECHNSGLVEIGAHTHSHPRLSSLSIKAQRKEISTSKERLEQIINAPVNQFAYPFGQRTDYNKDTQRVLKELGFKSAVVAHDGPNDFITPKYLQTRINGKKI